MSQQGFRPEPPKLIASFRSCAAAGNSQRDTDADGFGNSCDPDLNNDGMVNFGDFVRFQAGWLGVEPDLDFNGDGVTNFGDLVIFTMYMFGVPGQPPTP